MIEVLFRAMNEPQAGASMAASTLPPRMSRLRERLVFAWHRLPATASSLISQVRPLKPRFSTHWQTTPQPEKVGEVTAVEIGPRERGVGPPRPHATARGGTPARRGPCHRRGQGSPLNRALRCFSANWKTSFSSAV